MLNNILFIEKELNPTTGGVQRVTYLLAEGLQSRGYNTWYAFTEESSNTDLIGASRKIVINEADSEINLTKRLSEFVQQNSINLLICQNVYSTKMRKVYKNLKNNLGLKIIACLHANPDSFVNKNSLRLTPWKIYIKDIAKSIRNRVIGNSRIEMMRELYSICDRYVLLSESFIPVFKGVNKLSGTVNLVGINNPCTFQEYKPCEKENIILVVARMAEGQKRISVILKVWGKIYRQYSDWRIILVGGGGDLSRYKKIANNKRLERIEFIGPANDVEKYYAKSKIFLMTSTWEGLPMTMIEAQSHGCVPVAFDSFASLHDIVDGDNGIAVKNNDLNGLIQSVKSLMDDDKRLCDMSFNAISSSHKKFAQEKILDDWCNMISRL